MNIEALVFHEIKTEQHKSEVVTKERPTLIALPDARADKLIENVIKSYGNKSYLAYAGFFAGSKFQRRLHDLENKKIDFYLFSIRSLAHLKQLMESKPTSTGGYLTFTKYNENHESFVMVILLKDREGIGITKNLELEDVHSLDLDKLHFAAKININKWLAEDDKTKERHVSFLKGKSKHEEVVKYFKEFLGIDEGMYLDPAKHSRDLVNAIKDFCVVEYGDEKDAISARNRVHIYALKKLEDDLPITLDEIASLVSPGEPQKFINYIRDNEHEIPGEFMPTKELTKITSFRIKGEKSDYTLSFDQKAIEEKYIWLDAEGRVVINDVPQWAKSIIPRR